MQPATAGTPETQIARSEMKTVETCAMLGIQLLPHTLHACLYLEQHGFRFCIDFGYGNATEKAREHWRNRRRR